MKLYRARPTKFSSAITLVVCVIILLAFIPLLQSRDAKGLILLVALLAIGLYNAVNLFTDRAWPIPLWSLLPGYDIEEDAPTDDEHLRDEPDA